MSSMNPDASWAPDPTGRHQQRYWDGSAWTDHVSDGGVAGTDPVGAPPAPGAFPGQPPGVGQPPPYGQQLGYGYAAGGTGERPKSLKGLTTALTVLLSITGVAALLLAVGFLNRSSLLDDPFGASFDELQDADDAVAGGAGLFLLSLLATGIVWIVWQHRHAKNARALGQTEGFGPGWAIGGWFIPIANWVIPQLQLKQAAEASDPSGARKAPPVLIVWWVLYVIGGITGFATRNTDEDLGSIDDIEAFQAADQRAGVSMLVLIAAAIAAIVMVRTLTRRQHESLAARGMPT